MNIPKICAETGIVLVQITSPDNFDYFIKNMKGKLINIWKNKKIIEIPKWHSVVLFLGFIVRICTSVPFACALPSNKNFLNETSQSTVRSHHHYLRPELKKNIYYKTGHTNKTSNEINLKSSRFEKQHFLNIAIWR